MHVRSSSGSSGAVEALVRWLGVPEPGRPGMVLAAPGSGKTPLLLHLAERAVAEGHPTVVLSLGSSLAHLKAQHAAVAAAGWGSGGVASGRLLLLAVPGSARVEDIVRQVWMLKDSGAFEATRMVVDGLPPSERALVDLAEGSAALGLPTWAAMTCPDPLPEAWRARMGPAVRLEGSGETMLLRDGEGVLLPWSMDASTWEFGARPPRSTLGSGPRWIHGGAEGAEAAFGAAAAAVGLSEQTFTWAGRRPARCEGLVVLDDASLHADPTTVEDAEEVLQRSFSESDTLRRVLRLQAALAAAADEVVVVGEVLPTGSVSGGTGWAVEVAKRRGQPLWVFDQSTERWVHWRGGEWVRSVPALKGPILCGTGTRRLTDAGAAAIVDVVRGSVVG